jgi:hypothetical protein
MLSRKVALLGVAGALALAMVAGGKAEASSFETLPTFRFDFAPGWSPGLADAASIFVYSTESDHTEPDLDVSRLDLKDTDTPLSDALITLSSNQDQQFDADFNGTQTSVPEPATLGLLGIGLLGLSRRLRGVESSEGR